MNEKEALILLNQGIILTGLSVLIQNKELSNLSQEQAERTKAYVDRLYKND